MSKLPLWEVMRAADSSCASDVTSPEAKAILAVRDWLVLEEPELPSYLKGSDMHIRQIERQRLRALLTAKADRAERGDQPTSLTHQDSDNDR